MAWYENLEFYNRLFDVFNVFMAIMVVLIFIHLYSVRAHVKKNHGKNPIKLMWEFLKTPPSDFFISHAAANKDGTYVQSFADHIAIHKKIRIYLISRWIIYLY